MLFLECLQDSVQLCQLCVPGRNLVELSNLVSWVHVNNSISKSIEVLITECFDTFFNFFWSSSGLESNVLSHDAEVRWSKCSLIKLVDVLPNLSLHVGKEKG